MSLIEITLQNSTEFSQLPSQAVCEHWCRETLMALGKFGEVYIEFMNPEAIQALNKTYRHQDKPTNVLSFPFALDIPAEIQTSTLGDILICPQIVEQEALAQNKKLEHHFAHMIVHGTLHLLGYDHQTDAEAHQMESLEKKILKQSGIDNPYDDSTSGNFS